VRRENYADSFDSGPDDARYDERNRSERKKEKAENFIDTSIMNRLDSEGFVDAVYKEFAAK
jgi:hypothetical protein